MANLHSQFLRIWIYEDADCVQPSITEEVTGFDVDRAIWIAFQRRLLASAHRVCVWLPEYKQCVWLQGVCLTASGFHAEMRKVIGGYDGMSL